MVPMPAMVTSIRSPGCRNTGGCRKTPTPPGVPVVMTPKLHAGRLRRIIPLTRRAGKGLRDVDLPALEAKIGPLREKLRGGQFSDQAVAEAFALISEMSGRVLGMRHFDVQLLGGFAKPIALQRPRPVGIVCRMLIVFFDGSG